jgi:hypothetical protein
MGEPSSGHLEPMNAAGQSTGTKPLHYPGAAEVSNDVIFETAPVDALWGIWHLSLDTDLAHNIRKRLGVDERGDVAPDRGQPPEPTYRVMAFRTAATS